MPCRKWTRKQHRGGCARPWAVAGAEQYFSVLPFYRREAAAVEATKEDGEEVAEDGAGEEQPHIDLPADSDLTWNLQIISAAELTMKPGGEKETVECMKRQMWEANKPGRQVQAKISRLRYPGETEKAGLLATSLDEAAGGGKDKGKGKGKDAELDADAAAGEQVRRS